MPLPPHAEQTLQDFEDRLAVREKEVLKVKKEINSFLSMYDEPPRYEVEEAQEQGRGKGVSLKNDEFANFTSTSAALRHLLEKRGKDRGAIEVDEAFRLLKSHSYPFDGRMNEDKQKAVLRIAIGKDRNLLKHAHNDTVGLLAWYPGRKKAKGSKGASSEASGTRPLDSDDRDDENEDDAAENEGEAEASKPQVALPGSKGSD